MATMTDYRVDDLARAAGTTARNGRPYQERGWLPPPRPVGRGRVGGGYRLPERGVSGRAGGRAAGGWPLGGGWGLGGAPVGHRGGLARAFIVTKTEGLGAPSGPADLPADAVARLAELSTRLRP